MLRDSPMEYRLAPLSPPSTSGPRQPHLRHTHASPGSPGGPTLLPKCSNVSSSARRPENRPSDMAAIAEFCLKLHDDAAVVAAWSSISTPRIRSDHIALDSAGDDTQLPSRSTSLVHAHNFRDAAAEAEAAAACWAATTALDAPEAAVAGTVPFATTTNSATRQGIPNGEAAVVSLGRLRPISAAAVAGGAVSDTVRARGFTPAVLCPANTSGDCASVPPEDTTASLFTAAIGSNNKSASATPPTACASTSLALRLSLDVDGSAAVPFGGMSGSACSAALRLSFLGPASVAAATNAASPPRTALGGAGIQVIDADDECVRGGGMHLWTPESTRPQTPHGVKDYSMPYDLDDTSVAATAFAVAPCSTGTSDGLISVVTGSTQFSEDVPAARVCQLGYMAQPEEADGRSGSAAWERFHTLMATQGGAELGRRLRYGASPLPSIASSFHDGGFFAAWQPTSIGGGGFSISTPPQVEAGAQGGSADPSALLASDSYQILHLSGLPIPDSNIPAGGGGGDSVCYGSPLSAWIDDLTIDVPVHDRVVRDGGWAAAGVGGEAGAAGAGPNSSCVPVQAAVPADQHDPAGMRAGVSRGVKVAKGRRATGRGFAAQLLLRCFGIASSC